ncbi:hypothetical protein J4Q44_G00231120 [Coregonus suidteri]|uniref:Uncharacterized protein n=1 Tax=Coregonus suidteri TaxID=861788 RepID=A0AAN8QYD6_9TELE
MRCRNRAEHPYRGQGVGVWAGRRGNGLVQARSTMKNSGDLQQAAAAEGVTRIHKGKAAENALSSPHPSSCGTPL